MANQNSSSLKSTIKYYDDNAKNYVNSTINANMSEWLDKFEKKIIPGGHILDAGCGSGRDSKIFINHGYRVTAMDASIEMCKHASRYLGQSVQHKYFEDIEDANEYDGIWACASLLHVSSECMESVLKQLFDALKPSGILYTSYKYGSGMKIQGGRQFSYYTESTIAELLTNVGFEILECGISEDVRTDRRGEMWVNVIGMKANITSSLVK